MAPSKPLSLRRQKSRAASSRHKELGGLTLQADVFVETDVFHLDQTFSYVIPEDLVDSIQSGSIVKVPFKEREVLGVITAVKPIENVGLRPVSKALLPSALSSEDLRLIEAITERYVARRFDVLKQFLPPLSLNVTLEQDVIATKGRKRDQYSRHYLLSRVGENAIDLAVDFVVSHSGSSLLVLLPTERDIEKFKNELRMRGITEFAEYDGSVKPTERRRLFLEILQGSHRLVIGSRSAALLTFPNLDHIVVVNEASEHYFDKRAPYWNVRDVVMLRADLSHIDITFVGAAPSLELWRLIEKGWFQLVRSKVRILTKSSKVRTLPETYHSTIREGLKKGVVLVSVATKNYASTFICRKCKSVARCHCGGRIIIAQKEKYACNMCDVTTSQWRCLECDSRESMAFRGGAERIYEEIGKAFPRIPIKVNTADKPIDSISSEPSIVVSTYGVEPIVNGGYSALVLLDGEELISRPFIRAEEELRQRWFNLAGLVSPGSPIYLSIASQQHIAQSFISNRVNRSLEAELIERKEVALPPEARLIRISGDARALVSLRQKISLQFGDQVEALYSQQSNCLIIKCEHESASAFLKALRALQKARSLSKKELFKIEVDPYFI